MTLAIRPATPEDVPAILALIQALADYEHLAHEAVGTENLLRLHLFGPAPAARVLIGTVAGEVAGFALFYTTFSTFLTKPGLWLEDLFVAPAHRGEGLGKKLLASLAAECVTAGYGRLEWHVLDWNEPALKFYRAQGAVALDAWTTQRVTGEALTKLAASV